MLSFLHRSVAGRNDETGASAVEYGLLVAAIAALVVLIVFALGGVVQGVFTKSCTTIQAKAGTTETCATS